MTDIKKVIEVLKNCEEKSESVFYALNETILRLKEPETVKPILDYDGHDVWRCGRCGHTLFYPCGMQCDEDEKNCINYCKYCGTAVKWDE